MSESGWSNDNARTFWTKIVDRVQDPKPKSSTNVYAQHSQDDDEPAIHESWLGHVLPTNEGKYTVGSPSIMTPFR